jgi:glycosyltransferase involved in cell wall biosynthesis
VKHEVAIYTTSARGAGLYDLTVARDGGAERQMTLLARALVERGHRVAHIVTRPREPAPLDYPLTLVYREHRSATGGPIRAALHEALEIWKALRSADAGVVVLRSASPVVGLAAVYCRGHRRRLVFSSSNVSDFTLERLQDWQKLPYRYGLRRAAAVVVQSEDQEQLARAALPSLRRVVRIPSFAEGTPAPRAEPDRFLWFGRTVGEKQPLRYVRLAESLPEARFTMIPTNPEQNVEFFAEIRAAAANVPNLELLDPLPHAELAQLIARSAAVVNTSTLEGMPNSFLEAWLAGVPVLTFEFDPDGIVAGRDLGVAAGGSWERFVAGARELWESRADREEIAERVREHVRETHSPAAVGARWSALVAELRRNR